MGNQLTHLSAESALSEDLPNVVFKQSLGGGRFFKTSLCVHDDGGLVVVKVYAKRPDMPDLRTYEDRMMDIRVRLAGLAHPHALPYQRVYQSERAVYLLRQYAFASLEHRASSRPFLTPLEKRWIAHQLLQGLAQCHGAGVCHGDLRPENVGLTSWGWACLLDFAPFKPVSLPADNPADFSFFFDARGTRRAYLAPERFYDPGGGPPKQTTFTPAMDIFSLGCVLAELFLDGQPLFDYSRLLAYRLGTYDPRPALERLEPGLQSLLMHMLQRDPGRRYSAETYLQHMTAVLLPPHLGATLDPFFQSLLLLDGDARVAMVAAEYGGLKERLLGGSSGASASGDAGNDPTRATAKEQGDEAQRAGAAARMDVPPRAGGSASKAEMGALLAETQVVLHQLDGRRPMPGSQPGTLPQPHPASSNGEGAAAAWRQEASLLGSPATQKQGDVPEQHKPHEGMVLVAALLCTLLRGARLQEHKATVIALLCDAAAHCDDDTRLQRLVPYLVAAAAEPLAAVRCLALRGIARVLAQVHVVPPSDAKVFSEYVLPSLSLLPSDPELCVQVEYAAVVGQLASAAHALLLQQQAAQAAATQQAAGQGGGDSSATVSRQGGAGSGAAAAHQKLSYDEEVAALRAAVGRVVHELLVRPRMEAKLALLPHLPALVAFAGQRDTADVLLPPLLTFFNSDHPALRASLYTGLEPVCICLGAQGLQAIVMPFLDRMLGDPQPAVSAAALVLLARLCTHGLVRRQQAMAIAVRMCSTQLLGSLATVVRARALACLVTAAAQLSRADVYARLLPALEPFVACEPNTLQRADQVTAALAKGPLLPRPGATVQQPFRSPPPAPASRAGTVQQQQRAGTSSGTASRSGSAHAVVVGARPGSQSLLVPPATATYSILLGSRFLTPGSSYLSAALEQSVLMQLSGHLAASAVQPQQQQSQQHQHRIQWSLSRGAPAGRLPASPNLPASPDAGAALLAAARRNAPFPSNFAEVMGMRVDSSARGGPAEQPGSAAAERTGGPPDEDAIAAAAAPWCPRGMLVAHLAEHKKAVNRLAVAGSGAFFASASSDETIKVWDCRRLEKDISFRSRLTYTAQVGRITAVAAFEDSQSIASGSSSGSIHVWRVEHTSRTAGGAPDRYTGIVSLRQLPPAGGGVLDLQAWGPSLLVHSTQEGGVAGWDLRASCDAWQLASHPSLGVAERLACDPMGQNWLVTGSSAGWLTLWDVRFGLPAARWRHPGGTPIGALALAAAPAPRLGVPCAGSGPLLYVAAGESEAGLWDVAEAKCLQVLRVLHPGSNGAPAPQRQIPTALAVPPSGAARMPGSHGGADMLTRAKGLGMGELQAPQARSEGFRALLPTSGGLLLTGGTDRVLRCWDAGRPTQSYVVCTPPPAMPATQPGGGNAGSDASVTLLDMPRYHYAVRELRGVTVLEEICTPERSTATAGGAAADAHVVRMSWAERAAAAAHQQAVLDLVQVQASEALLLSASQDGVIKAWR